MFDFTKPLYSTITPTATLLLLVGAAGCADSDAAGGALEPAGCVRDGVEYPSGPGYSVPMADGCNHCVCEDGEITGCTTMACGGDAGSAGAGGVASAADSLEPVACATSTLGVTSRPRSVSCAPGCGPSLPLPSVNSTPPLGENACETHADCTAGDNGRCVSGGSVAGYVAATQCEYDECVDDADCPLGTACLCGTNNRCVPATCRLDEECGAGQRCLLRDPDPYSSCPYQPNSHPLRPEFRCTTPSDECSSDEDCAHLPAEPGGAGMRCLWDDEQERSRCRDVGECAL